MATKTIKINHTDIATVTDCMVSTWSNGFFAIPELNATYNVRKSRKTGNGDNIITDIDGLHTDNEYIISIGWGDGFAVNKIDNNGNITQVYTDLYPNNSYANYNAIAVDKVNKIAIIGNYVYDNLAKYDFSGSWENTPTKTTLTESGNNLPSDEVGDSYINALSIAGNWLYISPNDKRFTNINRWNIQTETNEELIRTGSVGDIADGSWFYDEPRDRMFHTSRDIGSYLTCIVSASSDTDAKAYSIRWTSAGFASSVSRGFGMKIDEDNPNHIWLGMYYQMGKLDITNCLLDPNDPNYTVQATRLKPSSSSDIKYTLYSPWFSYAGYLRIGSHPDLDIIWIMADRGWGRTCYGFIDQESGNMIFISRDNADFKQDNDNYSLDYGSSFKTVESPNGTKFWINAGYGGGNGNGFTVWDYNVTPELKTSWSFISNTFSMDNNQNITAVTVNEDCGLVVPTGTTGTLYVSNNEGSTWETYSDITSIHTFESTGNTFKFKFEASGLGHISPYFSGPGLQFTLSNRLVTERPINRRNRTSGFKLKGS